MERASTVRKCLPLVIALLLASCGGGGEESQGPEPVATSLAEILFDDDFDVPPSPESWTLSTPATAASPVPSSLALGSAEATTNGDAFLRGERSLDFLVEMSWPCDCPAGGHARGVPIQIVERASDLVLASVLIDIDNTVGQATVMFRIDPTGSLSPSSVVGLEVLPIADLVGAFHTYRLVILEDGYAQWSRNGQVFITSFAPLADQDLVLRLGGREGDGEPVLYDYVAVRRP